MVLTIFLCIIRDVELYIAVFAHGVALSLATRTFVDLLLIWCFIFVCEVDYGGFCWKGGGGGGSLEALARIELMLRETRRRSSLPHPAIVIIWCGQ